MKIHDKAKLVKRAEAHKEADRFIADQYLDYLNGEDEEFKGCEIGCLATPDGVAARKRWFDQFGLDSGGDIPESAMIKKIEREFGVCLMLQRAAERLLIEIPTETPARLGGFVVSFCRALPEGADVRNDRVRDWILSRNWPTSETGETRCRQEPGGFLLVHGRMSNSFWEKERKAFLDWLRRGAPEPRRRAAA